MNIDTKILNHFKHQVEQTRSVIVEIRAIKQKEAPSEADVTRLIELRRELVELCPPDRYGWIDGEPVIDIIEGLLEAHGGNEL